MAGIPHDHYEPKSAGEKWLHKRLPIVERTVPCRRAANLTEHRQVGCHDRAPRSQGFSQWQAEPLTVRGQDNGVCAIVERRQLRRTAVAKGARCCCHTRHLKAHRLVRT